MPSNPPLVTSLQVVADLPKTPVTLATRETMSLVSSTAMEAEMLTIANAETAQEAADLLNDALQLQKSIEAARETVKAPFWAICKAIDSAAKAPNATLVTAISAVRTKLKAWDAECQRRAAEAERQRQAELARLEKERLAAEKRQREAEEAARAAAAAAAPAVDNDFADFDVIAADDDKAAAEAEQKRLAVATAAVAQARAIVAPRPAGLSYRTTLKHEVIDVNDLPSELVVVTANDAVIRARFCFGWKEGQPIPRVPGLRFTVDRQPIGSTRR